MEVLQKNTPINPSIEAGLGSSATRPTTTLAGQRPTPPAKIQTDPKIDELNYDGYLTNAHRGTGKNSNSELDKKFRNGDSLGIIDGDINSLVFFPRYTVSNYSKDISNWRKQINPYGSKGFFYFKIYFNFHTNYGLLGGKIGDTRKKIELANGTKKESSLTAFDINTAYQYLTNIEKINLYKSEKISDRKLALEKFINGLKNVSIQTPWFFKEVSNLNNINPVTILDGDFENQSLNIICSEESVDMRLGTLFDLYKFACFNSIRNKEIIPANLRKFEMSILFMHVPLRMHQLAMYDNKGNILKTGDKKKEIKDKELNFTMDKNKKTEADNVISVKMLTFQNCEFDLKSMNEIPDSVSNEAPFDLGKNTIKINYSRVYEHRINEWEKIGFGQDGFIFDMSSDKDSNLSVTQARLDYLADKINAEMNVAKVHNDEKDIYQNLYGNFTNVHSIYQKKKRRVLKDGSITSGNIYNYDYERTGKGSKRINTRYLNEKLNGGHPNHRDAVPNTFKLSWDANALNYNNNMFNVEGNPGTAHTFVGKLAESTWQRIKSGFGF